MVQPNCSHSTVTMHDIFQVTAWQQALMYSQHLWCAASVLHATPRPPSGAGQVTLQYPIQFVHANDFVKLTYNADNNPQRIPNTGSCAEGTVSSCSSSGSAGSLNIELCCALRGGFTAGTYGHVQEYNIMFPCLTWSAHCSQLPWLSSLSISHVQSVFSVNHIQQQRLVQQAAAVSSCAHHRASATELHHHHLAVLSHHSASQSCSGEW